MMETLTCSRSAKMVEEIRKDSRIYIMWVIWYSMYTYVISIITEV